MIWVLILIAIALCDDYGQALEVFCQLHGLPATQLAGVQ